MPEGKCSGSRRLTDEVASGFPPHQLRYAQQLPLKGKPFNLVSLLGFSKGMGQSPMPEGKCSGAKRRMRWLQVY